MTSMLSIVRAVLVAGLSVAVLAACGGGASPSAAPTPAPPALPMVPNGTLTAKGTNGGTFTLTFSGDVPPGETAMISPLPPPAPCSGTGCTAVPPPVDGIEISVAPAPLPISAIANVGLTIPGGARPFVLELFDVIGGGIFTEFLMGPGGGPLHVLLEVPTGSPLVTLQPAHTYAMPLYPAPVPVTIVP